MANSVRFSSSFDDKVSGKLDRIRDKFDQIGGKGASASLFGNVGAKAIAKGFDLISMAAGAVTDVLGDSITAALDEEKSISKLDTALRANIKGWDGNRDAIESVLTARMALGFSDDEQRASLALLVAATNDVSKSLEIQRAAMDLARLKGISLEEATQALIKVDDGHYRVLQSLGITLADNATSTDALRAVQAAAAGQADAYAKTNSGQLLVSQVKVGEAMEKLGTAILPGVAAAMSVVADAVVFVIEKIAALITSVRQAIEWLGKLKDAAASAGTTAVEHGSFTWGGIIEGLFNKIQGHAQGGWVGLNGPEVGLLGEHGPEFVSDTRTATGGGMGGAPVEIPIMLDGREVGRLIDERLYYLLGHAAPQLTRA